MLPIRRGSEILWYRPARCGMGNYSTCPMWYGDLLDLPDVVWGITRPAGCGMRNYSTCPMWEGILVNCPLEILKVMVGIVKSSSRLLDYEIFISHVIDHLDIDTCDVEKLAVNSREHLVGDNMIHKMNIYKHDGQWMYQEDHNTTVDLDLSDEDINTTKGE
ncbi:hypothetical protein Lal_00041769 [Lupinus albus]|nr:hypothetical protein Lal_00041769 [Lupinus albus]